MIGIHAFSDMEVMSFLVERKATKVAFLFLMHPGCLVDHEYLVFIF
jgi:hypothetical protein